MPIDETTIFSATSIEFFGRSVHVPSYVFRLLLSMVIGLIVGAERAARRKTASFQTFSLISVGSCLLSVLSLEAAGSHGAQMPYDVTRVAAGIVTGIGFIGGGVIFKTRSRIEGVTTAAMIWVTAGLGMACGFDRPLVAIWGLTIYLLSVFLARLGHLIIRFFRWVGGGPFAAQRPDDTEDEDDS